MPAPSLPKPENAVTLFFTAHELAQLEAFATLHGVSVSDFIHRAALDAANLGKHKKSPDAPSALWLTEELANVPESEELPDFFAPAELEAPQNSEEAPQTAESTSAPRRGLAGERSQLAKGQGPVWDIRRALGHERVHGLGWTREQLAFVLKLSVVGVRKMEHQGTSPVKSLESRKALLELAKILKNPTPEIMAYIQREESALS